MRHGLYILEGHKPKLVEDIFEWGSWFETANRIVAQAVLKNGVKVSTVFMGLDRSFNDGEPILFETMIFGGKHDQYQERYSTWEEAEEGHKQALSKAEGDRK